MIGVGAVVGVAICVAVIVGKPVIAVLHEIAIVLLLLLLSE